LIKNILDGWRVEKLGKVFIVKDGTHDSPKYVIDNTTYPLLTSKNIKDGKLSLTDCNYISKEDFDKINKRSQVHKNDIIMPMIGTIGNPLLLINEPNFAIKNVALFKPKADNPKFLLHYLKSSFIKQKFLFDSRGGTQKFVSLTYLRNLPIPIPPLQQQKKIVKVLDISSALVEKQKELIANYDLFLKSKFIEMFGDPIKNPMGWEIEKLSNLGKWQSGGTPSRSNTLFYKGNIDWYSSGELNNLYTINSKEKITEEALKKSSAKLFKKNTILIGMYDTAAFKMSILKNEGSTNQAIANLDNNLEKTNVLWLYFVFLLNKKVYLNSRAGVRQQNLSLSKIKCFNTILPPITLQNKFAKIVEKIETIKTKETKKLNHLETLHKSLMDKAFKGEIK